MAPKRYHIRGVRLRLVRDSDHAAPNRLVSEPADAAEILAQYLAGEDRENIVVLLLNKDRHVIGINTVAVGSVSAVLVHPREVFKPALLTDAAAIILGRNHPEEEAAVTPDDIRVACEIGAAGDALQIPLLDFIIVAAGGAFVGLAERGLIPEFGMSGNQ